MCTCDERKRLSTKSKERHDDGILSTLTMYNLSLYINGRFVVHFATQLVGDTVSSLWPFLGYVVPLDKGTTMLPPDVGIVCCIFLLWFTYPMYGGI